MNQTAFALPAGIVRDVLRQPSAWLPYEIATRLADHVAPRKLVSADSHLFDFERFGQAGRASVRAAETPAQYADLEFVSLERGTRRRVAVAWFDVEWKGESLAILRLKHRPPGDCEETLQFIVSKDEAVADRFFDEVCRFCSDARGVVWVYARGGFRPDAGLYTSIANAKWDDLVLAPHLEAAVTRDFRRFLASKAIYKRYGAPYRRGALFVGPPGNGKTHAIRVLVNEIALPCLYVRSLKTRCATEDDSIADIFEEARDRAPCVLILEDLDAIITDETRSVFLNELDGFARNEGVITIATTNHPERLDPAMLERPSRFDRKYFFELPAESERARYLERWAKRLDPEARPAAATLTRAAARSERFSFAYLQELTLASLMRWVELAQTSELATMDAVLDEQLEALVRELGST
jgi:hypothetical protein